MTDAATTDDPTRFSNWQRVSPWAVLHFIVQLIRQSASIAIYLVPAYFVGADHLLKTDYFPWLVAAFVALFITSAYLRYLFFQFCMTEQGVSIRSGVLDRTFTDLPFERIQNVRFDQPFYFRFNQLLIVTLDTAGSSKQEATLTGIPESAATALKNTIMHYRELANAQTTPTPQSTHQNEEILNQRSLKDLVIHGITNNRVWILLGALAPFYENISSFVFKKVDDFRPFVAQWFGEQAVTLWYLGVMSVLLAIALIVFMALFSIGGSILMFYNYTLVKHKDKYVRRSGLINRQEVSMKQSRVQIARQHQDWLDKILGRVNLYFEQNVTGHQQPGSLKQSHKLLVPSVTIEQANQLSTHVFTGQNMRGVAFSDIHSRFMLKQVLLLVVPVTLLAGVILFSWLQVAGIGLAAIVLTLGILLAYLHWRRWGIASDEHYVYVRKGTLGYDYRCFPLAKLQQLVIKQSVFMRKHNAVSLSFVLASGRVNVPFVNATLAHTLSQRILDEVEVNKPQWM